MRNELLDVYVVDVCGTLVHDDTTLGVLNYHFARDNRRRFRYILFKIMTGIKSPVRWAIAVLEKLTGQHILKHLIVSLLAGDLVHLLNRSGAEYAGWLLAHRRVGAVWVLLDTPLEAGRVILASASLEPVVAALASALGTRYVASTLEHSNGVLTGRYASDLTGHKTQALTQKYGDSVLAGKTCAFSDNFSDFSLMAKATRSYVVLHKESHRQRWAGLTAIFLKASQ